MRLLVCGSRNWTDRPLLQSAIVHFSPTLIIHGGALGADSHASEIARALNIPTLVFLPDWKNNGRRAGFIRNQQMINEGLPGCILAAWDGNSRGTLDMMTRGRMARLPVTILHLDGSTQMYRTLEEGALAGVLS